MKVINKIVLVLFFVFSVGQVCSQDIDYDTKNIENLLNEGKKYKQAGLTKEAGQAFMNARKLAFEKNKLASYWIKNADKVGKKNRAIQAQEITDDLLANIFFEAGEMLIKDKKYFEQGYNALDMVSNHAQKAKRIELAEKAQNLMKQALDEKTKQTKAITDIEIKKESDKDVATLNTMLAQERIKLENAKKMLSSAKNQVDTLTKEITESETEIRQIEFEKIKAIIELGNLQFELENALLKAENEKFEKNIFIGTTVSLTLIVGLLIALIWLFIASRKKLKQANEEMRRANADIKKYALEKIQLAKDLENTVLQLQNTLQQKTLVLEENIQVKTQLEENKKESARSYDDLIRAVAHSFKNKISPLKQDFFNLFKFLRKIYGEQAVLDLAKFVRKPSPSEPTEDVDTYERLCNRIDKQLEVLPKIFNDFQVLLKDTLESKTIDLNVYFEEIKGSFGGSNYRIDIIPTEKPLLVKLDVDAFRSVIENLINNAVTHGFKENSRFYEIAFILSEEEMINGDKQVKILYKDNGVGFPENYDMSKYKTFGDKSVFSKGSGIGGYVVSKIVSLHNGKIALLPVSKADQFRTQIQILLPLHT